MIADCHPRLRIAITTDPEVPIPPSHYGGIERVIHFLVDGLTARGHEVVLFAHPDSKVACELVPYPGPGSRGYWNVTRNAVRIARRLVARDFEIVHSFGRLAYLTPLAWRPIRKIMSYQRPITVSSIQRAHRLFGASIEFTACSGHMIQPVASLGTWHVVHNGVPLSSYTFRSRVAADAPLVFLGRIESIKGPHLAIEAARAAGRSIVIAGNVEPRHQPYFDEAIRPHLDGHRVTYIGPVDDSQKNDLLGRAAALLMPILWDEPFGIVMAEALACGTPIVGFARGSVPEVVADGVTGFTAADLPGLVDGIHRLGEIDRAACRAAAEARFSDRVIVDAYESIYRAGRRLGQTGPRAAPGAAS
jgi:glycosyltransferase involved in cell wall biosynthesis